MIEPQTEKQLQGLRRLLLELRPVKVAVSGGVDSLTLAILASRTLGADATMFHARSPAVPPAATERVRATAASEGWTLRLVDAGEFRDPHYVANPYRRCFHCKRNLYATLATGGDATLVSGTNSDDTSTLR